MLSKNYTGKPGIHTPGILVRTYRWLRGSEQLLVRPAAELPLVLIAYGKADREGVDRLQTALEETWLTLPESFRRRYASILQSAPPLIVVLLRRRNICSCLGHHHPPGTESRLTGRLRDLSGVRTGELDLAYEAIRDWEPLPLSHLALPPEALLTIFLHEIHHLVSPQEPESVVRGHSQKFYEDTLTHFVATHYGVEYGLRHSAGDSSLFH